MSNTARLTSDGFSFILQEEPTQVHNILLHYIKRASSVKNWQGPVSKVVEILQFIFNLTLTEPGIWYKLQPNASESIR